MVINLGHLARGFCVFNELDFGFVISHESSGNPDAQNPDSTASGLFGFLTSTWTAVTGLPGPARDYSVAAQEAAFNKLYAEDGTAPWAPYDGC